MSKVGDSINPGSRPLKELRQEVLQVLPAWYSAEEKNDLSRRAISFITGHNKAKILLDAPALWDEEKERSWQQILNRLQSGEPWQYIAGETLFYGLLLHVQPGVLIPRPETEAMCHLILNEYGNRAQLRVADIGTGSGCIALALAAYLPNPEVHAFDVSADALKQAAGNAASLGLAIHLHLWNALREPFPLDGLDLLVSNPPYITEEESGMMRPNVLEYEPHTALFAPAGDALAFYRVLAGLGGALKPGAEIFTEINESLAEEVLDCFTRAGFTRVRVYPDLAGKPRMVRARNKE